MGFNEVPTVCQLFSNCPSYSMLSLMVLLYSFVTRQGGQVHLVSLSKVGEFVNPIKLYILTSYRPVRCTVL